MKPLYTYPQCGNHVDVLLSLPDKHYAVVRLDDVSVSDSCFSQCGEGVERIVVFATTRNIDVEQAVCVARHFAMSCPYDNRLDHRRTWSGCWTKAINGYRIPVYTKRPNADTNAMS